MNDNDLGRLARAINALRPDWPTQSLRTHLANHHADKPLRDVAVAMTWIACDPDTRTPARALEDGPWWQATQPAHAVDNGPDPELVRYAWADWQQEHRNEIPEGITGRDYIDWMQQQRAQFLAECGIPR